MGFFADSDGRAYIKYNTVGPAQHHAIALLSDDWMSSTGEYAVIFWKPSFAWMEGGGMFKRGLLYYYMTGTDCCFCEWGGDARFYTAFAPLGPWHPGVAPPLPTQRCDLSGNWSSVGSSPDAPGNETFTIVQQLGSDNFTFTDAHGSAVGWIDQKTGYVFFPPTSGDQRGVITSGDGSAAGCDRVRWYGYESFIWCRDGGENCVRPSYADAPELNYCADGSLPHEDVRLNPCDPNQQYGTNFTVPAQQFNVIEVPVDASGAATTAVLYYGERANSAPDGLFSHNFQAWTPLGFDRVTGAIQRMTFPVLFSLNVSVAMLAAPGNK